LPKLSDEAKEWARFVTTYRRITDDCQFTESGNMERLRKSLKGKARQCVEIVLSTNKAARVIGWIRG
jgi:hypothetical protein